MARLTSAIAAGPQQLVTYEYTPFNAPEYTSCPAGSPVKGCFRQRSGTWSGALNYGQDTSKEQLIAVDTGDLDRDTKDEIVLARYKWENDNIELLSFDADAALTQRATLEKDLGSNRPNWLAIATDDRDVDTSYATYTGTCYRKTEAQVVSVIFARPIGRSTTSPATTTPPWPRSIRNRYRPRAKPWKSRPASARPSPSK